MLADVRERAIALLARWAPAVEAYWHDVAGGASTGCYGPGYIHWGVQSNWNYAAAMATLSSWSGIDRAGHWRERAVAALRFALATHVTGEHTGNDGRRWGHSWISMLGIERGMHGVPLIADALTEEDHVRLRRVLVSEADWLLTEARRGGHSGVAAGLWNSSGMNNPESNIWSGALLWRTAQRYPDEPHAADWMERAHTYFVNGVSVPADAENATVIAGKPVSERFVGANFFPNYALDHHGYLNIGYMVICVSNAAMLHFDMRRAGFDLPASLTHHQAKLWQVLRRFVFGNGRLARIGGDSRVRYAYCQEYLLPALLFAADVLGDGHALGLVRRQLGLIEQEMAASEDGTFYGRRMGEMRRHNPHYFTRLESDRACALSMAANYLPLVSAPPEPKGDFEASVAGGWAEPEHGAVMHRVPTRLASFAWRAHGLTQALCLPPSDDVAVSAAEWSLNLVPVVRFLGDESAGADHRRLLRHHQQSFSGGFVTCGSVMEGVDVRVDEGARCTDQAVTYLAFAALPDGRTCLGLQLVVAAEDRVGYVVELKGLHLNVANDVFNEFRRAFYDAGGDHVLVDPPATDELIHIEGSWLNVDDRLGLSVLYGADALRIDRSRERRGGKYHSLYVDEVWAVPPVDADRVACGRAERGWQEARRVVPGQTLVDLGFVVLSGATAGEMSALVGGPLAFGRPLVRGAWVRGSDGVRYAVVANFGDVEVSVTALGREVFLPVGVAKVVDEEATL